MKIVCALILLISIGSCSEEKIQPSPDSSYKIFSLQEGLINYDIADTTLRYLSINNSEGKEIERIHIDQADSTYTVVIYSFETSGRLLAYRKYIDGFGEIDLVGQNIDDTIKLVGEIKYNVYCRSCHTIPAMHIGPPLADIEYSSFRKTFIKSDSSLLSSEHQSLDFVKEVDIKAIMEYVNSPAVF